MRLPNETSSSWVHITFAAFAWSSLKAWSEFPDLPDSERKALGDLSTSVKGHIDSLVKEARDTQDMILFGRPEAQATQNATLTLLKRRFNEAISILSIRLGNNSKNHPVVRQFAPSLLATLTGARISQRPGMVVGAAKRLAKGDDFDGRDALVVRLNDAATRAKAAIDANTDAQAGWNQERSEELLAKAKLRLELERVHRQLGAIFPGQRAFVESFFLKGDKPSEGSSEEETPPEEETPSGDEG